MSKAVKLFLGKLASAFFDVLPILLVVVFFQIFVVQKPFPNLQSAIAGFGLVVLGLFLFIQGLETALFPIGERMAFQFAEKGNVLWVVFFGFALGFATTIAEPALTIVAKKAGVLAAQAGVIENSSPSIDQYVFNLKLTIALSVGFAGALGVFRIIKGWPLVWFIVSGYGLIILATVFAPQEIIGIAYDAGGVTTSTITVPLITALGVGLATFIQGRNPMVDGFGLIALASLTPIMFVMIFGIVFHGPAQ